MNMLPHSHSWPTLHWWFSLNAAEQGAWISGIGTLAAAIVAVGIAVYGVRHERKREESLHAHRAKLLAIEVAPVLTPLRAQINRARRTCNAAANFFANDNVDVFRERIYLPDAENLPSGLALDNLPMEIAIALAECHLLVTSYNKNVKALPQLDALDPESFALIESLNFQAMLDQAQRGVAAAASEVVKYVPAFSVIKWLDRGDGTTVE